MEKEFKKIKRRCKVCGKPLVLHNNRDVKRKRFCSKRCLGTYTMANRKKVGTLVRECLTCGKEFNTYVSQDCKYCSRECFANKPLEYKLERPNGYIVKYNRGDKRKRVFLHVEVAESVLGRKLKDNECVHHINMIKTDNRKSNLLICDHSYHRWLHDRYAKRFAELHLEGGD